MRLARLGCLLIDDGKLCLMIHTRRNPLLGELHLAIRGDHLALYGGVKVSHRLEEAIAHADVIMMLRLQHERMKGGFIPSIREYSRVWGLTLARLEHCRPDVLIMHPGPVNRGVELAPEVADSQYSVILDQVTNGVAVRMGVLFLLAGGKAA